MVRNLIIFGTRPEAIKLAPVIFEFEQYRDTFETFICTTGQHRQMLDQVIIPFNIKPDYNLEIMGSKQDLFDITSKTLMGLREIMKKCSPDYVIVQGDTTTSVSAALAAFYLKIPVIHVEAGLRSHNSYSPWPEEINRSIISKLAMWHFTPTETARHNLLSENIKDEQIFVTGNTSIDALKWAKDKINNNKDEELKLLSDIQDVGYDLGRLNDSRRLILLTIHRRENFGERLSNICNAIKNLALTHPDDDFVYPVHLNPNIKIPVTDFLGNKQELPNIFLTDPLEYLPFVYLLSKAYLVLTDSGGIQEEAPSLGVPVIVLRDTTERPEAVESGLAKLAGTDSKKIENEVNAIFNDDHLYNRMARSANPFGDGFAAKRIVSAIRDLI